MRISLNLATRPYADAGPTLKRLRIAMVVLALISGGAALGVHEVHNQAEAARARAHSLDGEIARASAERQGYVRMMQEPENERLLNETKMLNGLFDEKAFSWTLTMESLETVLPGGVQVSTLEPARASDGHITLRMRVIGPRDKAIEFVRNLEHSRRFLSPRITGETAENTNGTGQNLEAPVSNTNRFSYDLLADYNPPTTDEVKAAGNANEASGGSRQGQHEAANPRESARDAAGHRTAMRTNPRAEYRRPAASHPLAPGQGNGGGR